MVVTDHVVTVMMESLFNASVAAAAAWVAAATFLVFWAWFKMRGFAFLAYHTFGRDFRWDNVMIAIGGFIARFVFSTEGRNKCAIQ